MSDQPNDRALVRQTGVVLAQKGGRVREAMRNVVGDLENVLGELKTVVGDLQVLVNQIDEVTNKIDEEYGSDTQEEECQRTKLSVETGMCQNGLVVRSSNYGEYKTQNIIYTQRQWLCLRSDYTVLTRNIITDLSPQDERRPSFGRVPSSDTSGCVLSSKDHSPPAKDSVKERPRYLGTHCFLQRRSTRLFSPMSLSSPESLLEFARSLPSPNSPQTPNLPELPGCQGHPHRPLTTGLTHAPDYCGIYEREVDLQLESALGEGLDNCPLEEQNILANETFSEYQAACKERVDLWAAYTVRDINVNPVRVFPGPFLHSPVTDTSSDDLNDNLVESSDLSSPEGAAKWAGSLTGSSGSM